GLGEQVGELLVEGDRVGVDPQAQVAQRAAGPPAAGADLAQDLLGVRRGDVELAVGGVGVVDAPGGPGLPRVDHHVHAAPGDVPALGVGLDAVVARERAAVLGQQVPEPALVVVLAVVDPMPDAGAPPVAGAHVRAEEPAGHGLPAPARAPGP